MPRTIMDRASSCGAPDSKVSQGRSTKDRREMLKTGEGARQRERRREGSKWRVGRPATVHCMQEATTHVSHLLLSTTLVLPSYSVKLFDQRRDSPKELGGLSRVQTSCSNRVGRWGNDSCSLDDVHRRWRKQVCFHISSASHSRGR